MESSYDFLSREAILYHTSAEWICDEMCRLLNVIDIDCGGRGYAKMNTLCDLVPIKGAIPSPLMLYQRANVCGWGVVFGCKTSVSLQPACLVPLCINGGWLYAIFWWVLSKHLFVCPPTYGADNRSKKGFHSGLA